MTERLPRFVIQKHAARRLHYDFRLEVDGVYRSWAVPKGPSLNPRVHRLAVPVEDHSLSWGDFEGTLEEGQYGAGTVIVWDRGVYRPQNASAGKPVPMSRALEEGRASIWLEGEKLRGGFTLLRTGEGPDTRWLLIKRADACSRPSGDILDEEPRSVITNRTLEEVAAGLPPDASKDKP